MAKKSSIRSLVEALAKERGVEITDIDKLGAPGVKGKLQEGAGFTEAFVETGKEKLKEAQEAFSPRGMKAFGKKAYMTTFRGDDIFSAYMRGRLAKKPGDKGEERLSSALKVPGASGGTGASEQADASLKVAAENSMSLPGIARDMNVLRQNMQQLVKIWGDKDTKVATGADAHFLKEGERSKKLSTKVEADKKFFEEQDKKEAELEAARVKKETGTTVVQEGGEGKEGGLLDSLMSMFSSGFMTAIKKMFSPKNLMNIFKRVFLPVVIIGTLFSGIMDGVKKYKETGSFSEAIVAGLGGMLSFLTFGLFGEDTLKNLWDKVSGFFEPVFSTITGIFRGIKDFFKGMFGGTVDVEDKEPSAESPKPKMPDTKAAKSDVGKLETSQAPSTSPTPAAKTASTTPTKTQSSPAKNMKAEEDYEKYEMAMGELQGIYSDYKNERGRMLQKLISDPRFKDGIPDDPSDPDYPEELKAIDDKYKKLISAKKSEIDKLKNVPGVKDYEKRIKEQEEEIEKEGEELAKASKVSGSTFTGTETVTGGGSKTTQRVMSEDAKKAQEELKKLDDKQAEERKKIVDKLKSEGKIKGRFATSTDFQNIDELKNLKAKQDAEREALIKRMDSGTSFSTTTSPGASSGGATPSSPAESMSAPAPMTVQPPSSGNELSNASAEIAEKQRMESAADTGSVVNAPVTNNSSASAGKQSKPKAASVYNDELASMLATT